MNKSSAQDDLLRDVAQLQANVGMLQETLNWKKDGVADRTGWPLFRGENAGKAMVAVKRKQLGLLRHARASLRWAMVVLRSMMFFSALYLPNIWVGETALVEYSETLK